MRPGGTAGRGGTAVNAAAIGFTLISVLGFGVWGLLMKMGQLRLGALPHLMAMGVTITPIVVVALLSRRIPLPPLKAELWLAVGATLATVAAMFFLVLALERAEGNTAAVVALSALYPGVTAVLATLFLGEPLGAAKLAGLVLAAAAAFLFTR